MCSQTMIDPPGDLEARYRLVGVQPVSPCARAGRFDPLRFGGAAQRGETGR